MTTVTMYRLFGCICILIQIVVCGVVADESSSFQVPLRRRKQAGVFAPFEDGQGSLIPYTECVLIGLSFSNGVLVFMMGVGCRYLTITLLASPNIDGFETSAYNSAEILVDTGSGLLDMYLKNTTVPDACKELYEKYPNSTIDQRLLTPVPANSPVCTSFTYSVPDPNSDACMFRISYGGGSTIFSGFAAQEEFAFENSTRVLGSSEVTLPPTVAKADLGGTMAIAAVENATNCNAFPGLGGMDNNKNSVVSQLVSQEVIGRHALSVCMSLSDNASFVIFGPAIPKSVPLNDVLMYNGTTIQSIRTDDDDFEESIEPLKMLGLSSHYYLILNGLQIGESDDAIEGPFSAILDSGFPSLGLTKSMLDQVNAQILANAQKNNLPVSGPGCFGVGPDDNLPEVVSRVIPNVTVFFTNETQVVIPGSSFAEVVVTGYSTREVCSTLLESSPQQVALGTSFFFNRFVQMDSALGIARMSEFNACPSIPPGERDWTRSDSISVKGSYTFPYTSAVPPQTCGLVVMMASIFIPILLHAIE